MTDIHDSALRACRQYEQAASDVARLTKEIGDALMECPTLDPDERFSAELGASIPGNWTHLKAVYKGIVPAPPDDLHGIAEDDADRLLRGDKKMPVGDWEIPGLPGDPPEDLSCPHCLKAHRAIQERKKARQRMGAAKRFIRSVGKRAIEQELLP